MSKMNQTNLKCAINISCVFLLLKVNKHKERMSIETKVPIIWNTIEVQDCLQIFYKLNCLEADVLDY